MSIITAKIVKDSVSEAGVRLTTMQLCYPRLIHSEFMTHRVFSRNASSSRAIPVAKMLEMIRREPAMPIHWGANQSGMQARAEVGAGAKYRAKQIWMGAAENACKSAEALMNLGIHKQVANRVLEPFQHIHVVLTSTEWDNFFALRHHFAADPNIYRLAEVMLEARNGSAPTLLHDGEWHLPYVTAEELSSDHLTEVLKQCSAARCARASYMNHDGTNPIIEKDVKLFHDLVGGVPIHASPVEHQARPMPKQWASCFSGNFRGWHQFRKDIEQSFINPIKEAA